MNIRLRAAWCSGEVHLFHTVVSRFTHHGRVCTVLRRYEYMNIPSTITQGLLKVLVRRALRAAILNAKFNVHKAVRLYLVEFS